MRAEPSETGQAVKALQVLLPRARVLYSSATGASEPSNLAYMTRIGSWGFKTMLDMIKTLGRCGHELVPALAMHGLCNVFKQPLMMVRADICGHQSK